ncbi:MAG: hypothetical protein ACFFD2_14445 [Promethearchaeota archaeon]
MAWTTFYPALGIIFIIIGSFTAIWFVIHVERGFRFSGIKSAIAIVMISIFFAFGIQLLLISAGAMG